uniref:Transcriptional and immune response regulator b n=2 Tax=Astyanax mexicanus TaxID=7994 RepID=W5LSN6_ASTMX
NSGYICYSGTSYWIVCPAMAGQVFDTARRKKASANIFADVKQDVLLKLFRRAGDMRAVERANSIVTYANDPERISRALKALQQQDKKDRFTLINGLKRSSIRLH